MRYARQANSPLLDLNGDRSLIRLVWVAAIMLAVDGALQLNNHLRADQLQFWRAVGSAGLMMAGLISLYLLRCKRNTLAFQVMIWGAWLIISAITFVGDGIHSPNMMIFPVLIFAGGWLLGIRTGLLIAVVSLAVTMASVAAEHAGWLPRGQSPPLTVQATTVFILLIAAAVFAYYTLASNQQRFNMARELSLALGDAEAKLNYVLSVAGQAVWQWDIVSDRVRPDLNGCRMMGLDERYREQPLAEFLALVQEDDREPVMARLRSCLKGGGPFRSEFRMHGADGGVIWLAVDGDVFERDEEGQPLQMLGGISDITERKKVESQLVAAGAAAEKANRAKSHFLAAASHDLRQPLLALSLYVGVLKKRVSGETDELTANIQECVDSLSDMLTDLLDVSKLDAGVVTPKQSDFAVDDLLATLASVHSAEIELKGLRLRLRYSGAVAHTDQQLLRRILGNLLANAVQYTDRGGILIAFRRREGKQWIEVWDTGIGIPADKTGVIFEEFMQLSDGARNRGTGLGLAIVAKTAALLGLQIRLRSRPGRGSMFAIELPPGQIVAADELPTTQTAARILRIALVEDNTMVLQALVLALQSAGHETIAARSGMELLEGLGHRAPDIIVSDYRLGAGETGFDVIAATRGVFGDRVPAIVVTGDTDPALIRIMADRGIAVHYKPLRIDALLTFIDNATERRSR